MHGSPFPNYWQCALPSYHMRLSQLGVSVDGVGRHVTALPRLLHAARPSHSLFPSFTIGWRQRHLCMLGVALGRPPKVSCLLRRHTALEIRGPLAEGR